MSATVVTFMVLCCGTCLLAQSRVYEYQFRLGRQRQVWFILLGDERGCSGETVRSLENEESHLSLTHNIKNKS